MYMLSTEVLDLDLYHVNFFLQYEKNFQRVCFSDNIFHVNSDRGNVETDELIIKKKYH